MMSIACYSRDRSFAVLGQNRTFALVMGAGSTLDRRRIS
jgi:hypothetical protein